MATKCPKADNWCNTIKQTIKTSFIWTIDEFSKCDERNGQYLESTTFKAEEDNNEWFLRLYPNGDEEGEDESVVVFLHWESTDLRNVSTHFSFALIDGKQQIVEQRNENHTFLIMDDYFLLGLIKRSDLMNADKGLLPNDRLTIYCELSILGPRKTTSGRRVAVKRIKTLSDDMETLFGNPNDSDVDIVVKGYKFRAHKLILKTRSPVFAAMFEHQMKESLQNEIIIEDIDKEVFERVLRFIYTDRVFEDDINSNIKLLSASDKYNLLDLKSICEQNIVSQLTVESVSYVLLMAEFHSAEELKTKSIEFIKTNFNKVVKTNGWGNVVIKPDLMIHF